MKRIGLIVFALLAVGIAVPVVLVATLPTANATIHAIRPTGHFVTRTNFAGQVVTGPEWLFGITNAGGATALWNAVVNSRPANDPGGFLFGAGLDVEGGVLKPGEGFVTNMIVAAGDRTEWAAWVVYGTSLPPFQQGLWDLGRKMPGLSRLLPRQGGGQFFEPTWHTATKAPTASSTVTNTP